MLSQLSLIAERFVELCPMNAKPFRIHVIMQLEEIAKLYPKFRWDDLENAPDYDFLHDMYGIQLNFSSDLGMLNCFLPRFAS